MAEQQAEDAKFCDICGGPAEDGREFRLSKAGVTVWACPGCVDGGFVVRAGPVVGVVGRGIMAEALGALFGELEQEVSDAPVV